MIDGSTRVLVIANKLFIKATKRFVLGKERK